MLQSFSALPLSLLLLRRKITIPIPIPIPIPCGRRRPPLLAVVISDEESELEGLLLVEPRIAERGVVGGEVVVVGAAAAARALGHGVAGELEVHAAEVGAALGVDGEGLAQLAQDVAEAPRLGAVGRRPRVPVHGVALPDHDRARELAALYRRDVRREERPHPRRPVPRDQRHLARLARRVQRPEEPQQVRRRRRRPHFHPDRVRDPPEELHVRAVQLSGPVPDPEEVR